MDTVDRYVHHAQDRRLACVWSQRGASMTEGELRIIEFLMTSDATRPADLPDWLLVLLEGKLGSADPKRAALAIGQVAAGDHSAAHRCPEASERRGEIDGRGGPREPARAGALRDGPRLAEVDGSPLRLIDRSG